MLDEKNEIIAGHGRLAAAIKLDLVSIPTITLTGLTPSQASALRLADNQIASNAGWDSELLESELKNLQLEGFDLDVLGLSAALNALAEGALNSLGSQLALDDQPKLSSSAVPTRCPKCGFDFVP